MGEINLLKKEYQGRSLPPFSDYSSKALYVVMALVVLEFLIYGGLWLYGGQLNKQAQVVDQEAQAVDFEIEKVEVDRLKSVSLQRRINNLQVLLNNHHYWSQVFAELEKYTLKRAIYRTMRVEEATQKFAISGIASSISEIGKLLLGLKQSPNVREVTLQSVVGSGSGESGYEFNLELVFNQKLLFK